MCTCTFDAAEIMIAVFLRVAVPLAPLHCTISFFTKGGSIFTTEFINRFMLYICLLFDFCFKSMKNRDSAVLEILCLMLLMLTTS